MNKNGSTTIKDVAERANVSQMTVSRVLNGQSSVKDTTRKRVQSAMRELNYRPNLMARKLAGRRGRFIGLVYRNPSYGYLSEFLIGALNACRELGHYLVVEEPIVDEQISDLELIERRFRDSSIQSLIVVPPLKRRASHSFALAHPWRPIKGHRSRWTKSWLPMR
jgi:LacI family transcriptional regulator